MIFLAHHVAVERLGREQSTNSLIEHIGLLITIALIPRSSVHGSGSMARKILSARELRVEWVS